jgi:hypothetical protein
MDVFLRVGVDKHVQQRLHYFNIRNDYRWLAKQDRLQRFFCAKPSENRRLYALATPPVAEELGESPKTAFSNLSKMLPGCTSACAPITDNL